MQRRKVYEKFIDLPQGVQDFFMESADAVYTDLIEKYGLSQEHFFEMIETPILNITLGFKTVPDGLNELYRNLINAQVGKDSMRAIIKTLLEKVFWPLRDLFDEELRAYLQELGIDPVAWTQSRVLFKPISYSGAVSEILNRLNMSSVGKQARGSLREIIAKYSKGELVPDQVTEAMVRLPEFGGLGFDKLTAGKALAEIQKLSKQVEFLSEEEYAEQLTAKTVKMKGDSEAEMQAVEDDEEIKTLRGTVPAKTKVNTVLDEAVVAAWLAVTEKPADSYLERRLKNVISSRLRDVRSSNELVGLLQRDTKVGGMGLTREKAQEIANTIEATYQDFHGKIDAEEKKKLEKQLSEQKRKIEERRLREAEEHARWYKEKIKAKNEQEEEKKQLAEALKIGLAGKNTEHPVMQAGLQREKKQYGELVQVPAKATAGAPAMGASIGTLPDKTVKVSLATLKLAATPKIPVDGVRATPKLSGLTGELQDMTLAQFRRMGAKPEDAVKKILDRLETLKQESFEQKVAGIRAWQSSPIMKIYLGLVADSFKNRKPIVGIAEEKRKAGEDTLTSDEIEALIQLNNTLHF